jgi:hypothetical protein
VIPTALETAGQSRSRRPTHLYFSRALYPPYEGLSNAREEFVSLKSFGAARASPRWAHISGRDTNGVRNCRAISILKTMSPQLLPDAALFNGLGRTRLRVVTAQGTSVLASHDGHHRTAITRHPKLDGHYWTRVWLDAGPAWQHAHHRTGMARTAWQEPA